MFDRTSYSLLKFLLVHCTITMINIIDTYPFKIKALRYSTLDLLINPTFQIDHVFQTKNNRPPQSCTSSFRRTADIRTWNRVYTLHNSGQNLVRILKCQYTNTRGMSTACSSQLAQSTIKQKLPWNGRQADYSAEFSGIELNSEIQFFILFQLWGLNYK